MRSKFVAVTLLGVASAYTDIRHKRFMIKNIDPIVLPGQYRSHMHSFYGSDVVTKDLPTTEELQKGCPSGENPNDLSVYWAPTLYHVGPGGNYTEVNPVMFSTYYENIDKAEIPFPRDFYAVAGNASAKSQTDIDERLTAITWWCENGPEDRNTRPRAALPTVTCSTHIQAILRFPDCVNVDNIKKYSYAAANGGRCPSDMKRMPQLRFSIRYDVGEGYCLHGDFINGWFDDAQQNLLKATGGRQWMRIDGAKGLGKAGSSCQTKDADPEHGTSDYKESLKMMSMA
ncbi:hypothetical protein B0H63DRAFT_493472 [Podospora didyma]|uniref:DUF1996 domain-containing protein n=1 Tax=Podospora didyma TaxID=330526 RepID=A0AAE0NSH2_9PEZI|nr:hypothetical protein B0H63DRAFT_493472 [Podospora didyma]